MRAKIILTGSLRNILKDRPEETVMELDPPVSIRQLLIQSGINPRIVMKVFVDGIQREKEEQIDKASEIVLMGPVSGG
jgi:hypothetical protein